MNRREIVLRRFLSPEAAETLLGDLNEELSECILPRYGPAIAGAWGWFQVLVILLQFSIRSLREAAPSAWGSLTDGAVGDVRFALRSLRKRPAFVAIVLTTLALGIGANTAIFSVVNALVLRPLPFREPARLVHLFEASQPEPSDDNVLLVRPGNYHEWKRQNSVFESMTGFSSRRVALSGAAFSDGPGAEIVWSHRVAADFFETVGVKAILGRPFLADDYRDASRRVVILSDRLWRRRFAADPAIVGREIALDMATYQVVGIMPPEFYPTAYSTPELWTPLVFDQRLEQSRVDWLLTAIARLKPGVPMKRARADLEVIARRLNEQYPEPGRPLTAVIKPMTEFVLGRHNRLFALLLVSVALLLLTASFNVASLIMARSMERAKEITIRAALGAGRIRLARQSLTESMVLALTGGVLGILLAYASVNPIRALLPASSRLPRIEGIELDVRVCLFAVALSLVTGLLFGLLPALHSTRADVHSGLRKSSRGNTAGSLRLGSALVVAEVAVSLTLLIGAGLVVRSFILLEQVDAGIQTSRVLTLRLRVPQTKYSATASVTAFLERIERGTQALPGAEKIALAAQIPFEQPYNPWSFIKPGQQFSDQSLAQRAHIQRISPGYFQTLDIPLLRGRYLEPSDVTAARNAVVINQTMARRYWGDEDPVGTPITVSLTKEEHEFTIIGVVGDARLKGVASEPYPEMFWPVARFAVPDVYLMLRTPFDPVQMAPLVRAEIARIDADVPVTDVRPLDQVLAESLWRPRLATSLLSLFALVTLVLAAAGLYGVLSRAVSQRTQELGVRIAVGAQNRDILGLVLGHGFRLTVAGIGIGLVLALVFTQLLSSQLFGVSALDPLTIAGVSALLLTVSLLACCVPALRAIRIDPIQALRNE